jgi:TRAP-type uncharacterized transport system substrate-binding protein
MRPTKHIFIFLGGLILCFIISIYVSRFKEHFQMYRNHIVQLKTEVTNPTTIAVGPRDVYTSKLMNLYSKKFPLLLYNNPGSTYNSLQALNNGTCNLAITQTDLVETLYKGESPFNSSNKDIRIVCGLNYNSLLFMARNTFTVKNVIVTDNLYLTFGDLQKYVNTNPLTICIDSSDETTYHTIMKILYLYKFNMTNINITRGDIFDNNMNNTVTSDFQSGAIDILITTIVHPDDKIRDFYQRYPFNFIGIDDIKLEKLHVKSPCYIKDSINLADYEVSTDQLRTLEVFSCPLCIVATKQCKASTIYRFVNGLFENIEYLHKNYKDIVDYSKNDIEVLDGFLVEQDFYKIQSYKNTSNRQINSLRPSSFYNIKSLLPLHDGTKEYFKKIGLITYNDSESCKNYLPDGNPRTMQNAFINCNSNPELANGRHYGHGIF